MYVGLNTGTIQVMENEMIIRKFNGCNGNAAILSYILFDDCGLMATSCYYSINQLYLYYPNGIYLSKRYPTPFSPKYVGYDSKGHFIQISQSQISIFN